MSREPSETPDVDPWALPKWEAPKVTAPKVGYLGEVLGADGWIEAGVYVKVESSNVAAIKYVKGRDELHVEFKAKGRGKNPRYAYHGVPEELARRMFLSESMGRFVWENLRTWFRFTKLTE